MPAGRRVRHLGIGVGWGFVWLGGILFGCVVNLFVVFVINVLFVVVFYVVLFVVLREFDETKINVLY